MISKLITTQVGVEIYNWYVLRPFSFNFLFYFSEFPKDKK